MPYPSRACGTCKKRRVKCDLAYPECQRCAKAGKSCSGYTDDPTKFRFQNENEFAGGNPRRPQKRAPFTTTGTIVLEDNRESGLITVGGHSTDKSRTSPSLLSKRGRHHTESHDSLWDPTSYLSSSLTQLALADFAARHISHLEGVSDYHWGHLKHWQHIWQAKNSPSPLEMAVTATSLASFGRTRFSISALTLSTRKYSEALMQTQRLLNDDLLASRDETLLTVSSLAQYERITCDLPVENLLSQGFRHEIGLQALLELRAKGGSNGRSWSLDRNIRQHILQNSILRGEEFSVRLHDNSRFALTNYERRLDEALVTTSQLRCGARRLGLQRIPIDLLVLRAKNIQAREILEKARVLDDALLKWTYSIPTDFSFSAQESTSTIHRLVRNNSPRGGDSSHIYNSIGCATIWNQHRVARMVTNVIMVQIMRFLDMSEVETGKQSHAQGLAYALQNIEQCVDHICASVDYILYSSTTCKNSDQDRPCITAKAIDIPRARLLVFPLCAVGCCPIISRQKREWAQSKLRLISGVTGSKLVEVVSKAGPLLMNRLPT